MKKHAAILGIAAWCAACGAGRAQVFMLDGMAVDPLDNAPVSDQFFRAALPDLRTTMNLPRGTAALLNPDIAPETSPQAANAAAQHLGRAGAFYRNGELSKALLEIQDALIIDPRNPRTLNDAAALSISMREFRAAKNYLERYLELQPDSPLHRANLAGMLIRLYRFDEAEAQLAIVLEALPGHVPALFYQSCLRVIREEPLGEPRQWRRLSLNELEVLLRWLQVDRPEWERIVGVAEFEKLCDFMVYPGSADTLLELREIIAALAKARAEGDEASSIALLDRLNELGVRAYGVESLRAELAITTGRREKAFAIWQDLIDRDPDWPETWLNYAHFLLRAKEYGPAADAAMEAKARVSDSPVADFVAASALALGGRTEEADPIFRELVLKRPDDVKRWLETDPLYWEAVKCMPNQSALLRGLGFSPENQ